MRPMPPGSDASCCSDPTEEPALGEEPEQECCALNTGSSPRAPSLRAECPLGYDNTVVFGQEVMIQNLRVVVRVIPLPGFEDHTDHHSVNFSKVHVIISPTQMLWMR